MLYVHVDLCKVNNGGCEHVCTNTQSGVSCSCNDGYLLANNQNCTGEQLIVYIRRVLLFMYQHTQYNYSCLTL